MVSRDRLAIYSDEQTPRLVITLNSDLCAGSGDGFSGSIDQDVSFDGDGVPLIPGRRIKGCLREAAQEIGEPAEVLMRLFGVSGSGVSGTLRVGNAVMVDAVPMGDWQATLNQYTYTRAQTRIDPSSGSAMDGTLRFIRVVKQCTQDGSKTSFVAPISLETASSCKDEACADWQALQRTAKALRNIGLGRNRGLGAVRCELLGSWDYVEHDASMPYVRSDAGGVARISYCIRLDSSVMLPQLNGTRGADHIPGSSVYGYFASQAWRSGKLAQEEFEQIFYSGAVRFSPLYPVDAAGKRCLPAAPFLVKVKGGSRDGALFEASSYRQLEGEAPKPLKDGFVSPTTWSPVEVVREVTYHHSTGKDATLYTQECLSAGQLFGGFIECPSEHADLFENILKHGALTFGRSKTAQYARCSTVTCTEDHSGHSERVSIRNNGRYVLLLDSDVLIAEGGSYSVEASALERELGRFLGDCFAGSDAGRGAMHPISNIRTCTIAGYNAKWNQKKPHVQAFAAGSCVAFEAAADHPDMPATFWIGERKQEGYGLVRIIDLSKVMPANVGKEVDRREEVAGRDVIEIARMAIVRLAKDNRVRWFAKGKGFSASFVGRLALMVTESTSAEDLDSRIASIKDGEGNKKDRRDLAQNMVSCVHACLEQCLDGGISWHVRKNCFLLLLTLGKYFQKQMSEINGTEGAGDEE